MDKATLLKGLIIAVLVYYLMKGIIYLVLWQVMHKVEERSKARAERNRKAIEELRKNRKW